MRDFCKIEPGSGGHISFWYDNWTSNSILAVDYPRVVAVAIEPAARITDIASFTDTESLQDHLDTKTRRWILR
ncbi:unnamed protein product [Linum trigynum]|uniref:Uncharacterized protein n=1 Tax=Linum trigynum TaxID=586398 RepID=A0AAV2DWJ5_9ROSI